MNETENGNSKHPGNRFSQIVRAALDAAVTMDARGVIIDWNDAATDLLGWEHQEAIGQPLGELIVPEGNRGRLIERLEFYQSSDDPPLGIRRFKTEALHRDGHEIPIELSVAPILNDGDILFSAFVRDLRSQIAEVQERGQLAAIVDSSVDAIIGKDLGGIITTWNAGAEMVYGYSAEEAIGQPVSITIPDEVAGEEPELLQVLTAGQKLQSFEVVRRRKDGRLIDVSISQPVSF